MSKPFKELLEDLLPSRRKKIEEKKEQLRRDLMSSMSEFSRNPATIVSDEQEKVALFMVEQLKGLAQPLSTGKEI